MYDSYSEICKNNRFKCWFIDGLIIIFNIVLKSNKPTFKSIVFTYFREAVIYSYDQYKIGFSCMYKYYNVRPKDCGTV